MGLGWFPAFIRLGTLPIRDMLRFSGRSRRSEVLAFYCLGGLANLITLTVIGGDGAAHAMMSWAKLGWSLLWGFPWLALLVRRLHDQGHRGAWVLVAFLIEACAFAALISLPQVKYGGISATFFFWEAHAAETPLAEAVFVTAAIGILAIPVVYFLPAQPGANRYGPDPRLDPEDAVLLPIH
jgi:uncharacterized membrane protein YhaH (DUF805 family)